MRQVTSEYLSAFEKLMNAYASIADALPRFDILESVLKTKIDFQYLLADFYSDILEFHGHAYAFIRSRSWKHLFDSAWGRFDRKFGAIIKRLEYRADLIDKEANAYNIASVQQILNKFSEDAVEKEKERSQGEFVKVIAWLDIHDYIQEDYVDQLDAKCHQGTADWFLQHGTVSSWMDEGSDCPLVWINGTPGCGESSGCLTFEACLP